MKKNNFSDSEVSSFIREKARIAAEKWVKTTDKCIFFAFYLVN